MKYFILMPILALVLTVSASAQDGSLPPFKLSIEGMMITRDDPGSNRIVVSEGSGAELFNTDEFDFSWEFNLRIAFEVNLSETSTIEAVYFGLGEWSDDQSISSASSDLSVLLNGVSSGPSDAFDDATNFSLNTESELYSIELNYLHAVHPSVRILAGLRLVNLDERAQLTVRDDDVSDIGRYHVETENLLLGGQLGVAVDHELGYDIFVRGGAKVAGFWAHRQQDSTASEDVGTTVFRDEKAEDDGFSWLFEGEVLVGYRVTRHINVFGGYRVLYISDVASATDQFVTPVEPAGSTSVELTDILYHGPTIGAEVTF